MSSPAHHASGGALQGHGVAFALIGIFAGMALIVSYADSDGTIFGQNSNPAQGSRAPINGSNIGGAVISSDGFDEVSPQSEDSAPPPEPSSALSRERTLSEEEKRLLAMSDFSWNRAAELYVTSNQDVMNTPRQPVPVQTEAEPLALSDDVTIDIERARNTNEVRVDLMADTINIDIPVDLTEIAKELEKEFSDIDEELQDIEDQGEGARGSGLTNDDLNDRTMPGEGSSGDDGSGDGSGLGNGDESGFESGDGNSSHTKDPSADSGSEGVRNTGGNFTNIEKAE